jgi:general secretion pathway protein G
MVTGTPDRRRPRGFTILELMVVISVILILISVAAPRYAQSILRAREAVLRNNLLTLRSSITQYTMDKQKAPQSLEELVTAGYLREIPQDPMTNSREWEVIMEDAYLSVDQTQPGIWDVKSTAPGVSTEGTAYNSW